MFATRHGKLHTWCLVLLIAAAIPTVTGCYGRFPLTKTVYKFNGEVSENKWVRSLVMWGMIIIPVYKFATLGDVIVINLIEFWTGNQINVGRVTQEDGIEHALTPGPSEGEAVLTASRDGKVVSQVSLVRASETKCEVRDSDGKLLGMALRQPSGGFHLTDAAGQVIRALSAEDVATALAM